MIRKAILTIGTVVLGIATVLPPEATAEQTERELTDKLSEGRRNGPMVKSPALRAVKGGQKLDKPTFGEKFMFGLKKAGSRKGKVGKRQ